MTPKPKTIAWVLAALGGLCTIGAAYLQGGNVAALGAAGISFTAAAGILGWNNRLMP